MRELHIRTIFSLQTPPSTSEKKKLLMVIVFDLLIYHVLDENPTFALNKEFKKKKEHKRKQLEYEITNIPSSV